MTEYKCGTCGKLLMDCPGHPRVLNCGTCQKPLLNAQDTQGVKRMNRQLQCESRLCMNIITDDMPIVTLAKKLRADANSATHSTLACSLACMMQILAEFVQEESKKEHYRTDSLLAKNIQLEKALGSR